MLDTKDNDYMCHNQYYIKKVRKINKKLNFHQILEKWQNVIFKNK